MTTALFISVPATTANLGAGFDTLGLALTLRNDVWITPAAHVGLAYQVEGEGAADVAAEPGANLFDRVLRGTLKKLGSPIPAADVRMLNRIPWRRGLGSSSAAAVAGAVAGLSLAGAKVDPQTVLDLALPFEGHPDNLTPAIAGGFTAATLANGVARFVRLPPPKLAAVALVPSFGISTVEARRLLPAQVSLGDAVHNLTRASLLVAAIAARRYDLLDLGTEDRLHQPHRARLVPGFEAVRGAAREAGALASFLSGSGPTILALGLPARSSRIRAAMLASWSRHGRGEAQCLVLEVSARGAIVRGAFPRVRRRRT